MSQTSIFLIARRPPLCNWYLTNSLFHFYSSVIKLRGCCCLPAMSEDASGLFGSCPPDWPRVLRWWRQVVQQPLLRLSCSADLSTAASATPRNRSRDRTRRRRANSPARAGRRQPIEDGQRRRLAGRLAQQKRQSTALQQSPRSDPLTDRIPRVILRLNPDSGLRVWNCSLIACPISALQISFHLIRKSNVIQFSKFVKMPSIRWNSIKSIHQI